MSRLRAALAALAALALAAARAEAATIEWTGIDVQARLDNEGRLHVVETHRMRVERGGYSMFREFGLGADQAIALRALWRVDADGREHALSEGDVDGPERFRYYPRGHAHFQLPELDPGAEIAYRFEYELLRAVAPAWGIIAGPDPLAEDDALVSPWRRLRAILADWDEARPDPLRRYRLDHDVLFPSREGPAYVVRRIDYRLQYGDNWRDVHPEAELATVVPDSSYRVRPLFEYLGPERPAQAAWRESALRIGSLAALPVLGLVLWLSTLLREWVAMRRIGPVRRELIEEQLLPLAPEQVRPWLGGGFLEPTAEDVLNRLVAERRLSVELGEPEDADEGAEAHLRLLAPLSSFREAEREFLEKLFPKGRTETSSAELRRLYAHEGFDPEGALRPMLADPLPATPPRRWLGAVPWLAPGALGVWLELRSLPQTDYVVFLLLANVVALLLVGAWPRAWWHGGLPRRGLLLPLALLLGIFLAVHLSVNRPLPARLWAGTAVAALAGYGLVLGGSRMPGAGPYRRVRTLARIRGFARAELKRARPRLEDRWIPHLEGLGLGKALEAWRVRHGGSAGQAPDLSSLEAGDAMGRPFLGQVPQADLARGWTESLYVLGDDEGADDA